LPLLGDESVQLGLGYVTERRMAKVVSQAGCFDDIRVDASQSVGVIRLLSQKLFREASANLPDF
jgi:hypothetical protein